MEKIKLKPCDCHSFVKQSKLNEVGIGHNDQSIRLDSGRVVLEMGHTTVTIPGKRFKMFAEWYLEEQELKNNL